MKFIEINVIDLFKTYGITKLDDIPNLILNISKNGMQKDFPQASEWLVDYYHRMKVNIYKEFIK